MERHIMRVKKGKHEYVCTFLKPGYFETGILRTFLQGSSERDGLPAYFWNDNCDYDEVASCYVFDLPTLANKNIVETVYIPREYVLATMVHKSGPPPEMGKIGFKLPTQG
jgi:hypothetical protein